MKRKTILLLIYILILCITAPSAAQGAEYDTLVHEHTWSEWNEIRKADCLKKGYRTRTCTSCGKTEREWVQALGHETESWTIIREPDCRREGKKKGVCIRCGRKMTESIPKTGHDLGEWTITKKATDFAKGRRTAVCSFCGTSMKEEFYPEGTLAVGQENDPEAVKALQTELAAQGFYQGIITGKFENSTAAAVKKAETSWNLTADGIAWPGFIRLLGLPGLAGRTGGEAISKDPSSYRYQLDVIQISPEKAYYQAGDELTYQWTLRNASEKYTFRDAAVYHFDGKKAVRKTDVQIGYPDILSPGERISGTFTYQVTAEDEKAGTFSHGLLVRGRTGNQAGESNAAVFVNASSAAAAEKAGWRITPAQTPEITKTVASQPQNSIFYTEGETVRFRTEIRNWTGRQAENACLTDGTNESRHIGTLEDRDIRVFETLYRVTAEDAEKGEIISRAVLSYEEDGEVKEAGTLARVPAGEDTGGMYVYGTCISEPQNGLYFIPGETVEFRIRIVNSSARKTYSAVRLYNPLYSDRQPYRRIPTAEPGASAVCFLKTTVTEEDAQNGSLTSVVNIYYQDQSGKKLSARSNECTVSCGPAE